MHGRIRRRTPLTGVAIAAVAALGVTACGTKETGAEKATHPTITYWSSWISSEPQARIFSQAIADYEKATGVTVDVKWLGRDYPNQVKNAGAVGKAPDVYDDASDHIGDFRSHNLVADLSGVLTLPVPNEGDKVGDVMPSQALKASSDSTGLALIPYTVISSGIWFDAATHPEWAANPPATFDDLLATAEKLKAAGHAPFAQDGTVNGYNAYWIYWLLMRHGGPGTMAALGRSPAGWDDPAVLAAARDVERLVKAGLFEPDYMATKYPAAQNQWASRTEDMNINGTWLNSETSKYQASGFQAQMFLFPSVPGGKSSVEVGTLGWSLNPKSPNVSTAESFLAFMAQKKYMSQISTKALNIPSRSDVPAPTMLLAAQQAIVGATASQPTDDGASSLYSGWWNDVFLPLDDQLLSGKISAQQFVSMGKSQTASYH
ncbi:ABC-type glycerol-3-phosphate transport system substrate-binding protein [Catenulispora sp. GAS73]|uniref:sugar ABC transporter substrate-binding protein n=1 Tax=Catenulispora sp. GAS73 TaxID=3156269 RepID=UPI0035148951